MLTVFVLVAVLLLDSGETTVETFQYSAEEDCKAGAESLQLFLRNHETGIISAAWACTKWQLVEPARDPPAEKRSTS